jgi:cysteine dioxygenase
MRILKGSLLETRYNPPSGSSPCPTVIRETTYTEGELAYMADDLGVHKISNPSSSEIAVSLHLYTPPNAAREGCNVFCPRTGKRSHVLQNNFYSVRGVKVKE